jgi:hypothetical protein
MRRGSMSAIGTNRTIRPHPRLSAIEPKRTKVDFSRDGLSANDPKRTCSLIDAKRLDYASLGASISAWIFSSSEMTSLASATARRTNSWTL